MEETIEYWYGNPSIEISKGNIKLSPSLSTYFCITDIPTSLILSDLFNFLETFLSKINQLKVFRTSSSKVYCCAVWLKDSEFSLDFLKECSDKRYNSLEDHSCTLFNITDCESLFQSCVDKCPICLEELDFPAISILCGHLFHIKCLEMWSDTTCPVCRFHQTPPDTSVCDTCGEESDIRMCLICGELGCNFHSNEHFHSTGHTYFQIIETSITWDYSRQISISRLIASNDKIIEVQSGKKIENLMFEYNCLLSSLLETQREFYENKLQEIENSVENPLIGQIDGILQENEKIKNKIEDESKVVKEIESLNQQILYETQKKNHLNAENLRLNQGTESKNVFKVTKEVLDEVKDLEAQIKEMNFYISTQKQLKDVDIESVEIRKKK